MPNIQSAKKALRQNVRHRTLNVKRQEAYKKAVKEYKKLVSLKDKEGASKLLSKTYKTLDKAAKTGVIKKNKANRLKARLAAKLK